MSGDRITPQRRAPPQQRSPENTLRASDQLQSLTTEYRDRSDAEAREYSSQSVAKLKRKVVSTSKTIHTIHDLLNRLTGHRLSYAQLLEGLQQSGEEFEDACDAIRDVTHRRQSLRTSMSLSKDKVDRCLDRLERELVPLPAIPQLVHETEHNSGTLEAHMETLQQIVTAKEDAVQVDREAISALTGEAGQIIPLERVLGRPRNPGLPSVKLDDVLRKAESLDRHSAKSLKRLRAAHTEHSQNVIRHLEWLVQHLHANVAAIHATKDQISERLYTVRGHITQEQASLVNLSQTVNSRQEDLQLALHRLEHREALMPGQEPGRDAPEHALTEEAVRLGADIDDGRHHTSAMAENLCQLRETAQEHEAAMIAQNKLLSMESSSLTRVFQTKPMTAAHPPPTKHRLEGGSEEKLEAVLARAKHRFDKLDADGNGVIDGTEVLELTNWLWWAFHPGGEPLTDQQRNDMASTLLRRVDSNEDGVISFEEFAVWFRRTSRSIHRFQESLHRSKAPATAPVVPYSPELCPKAAGEQEQKSVLVRAKHRFDKLDADGNGVIDGTEVLELTNWLWWAFHPGGEPLTDQQRNDVACTLLLSLIHISEPTRPY
eukprot:TRINITY_DN3435_c0_g1_i5.p1 TRINITY_DN3435_c0_g1~~TRINITY_DN3435_c0_g1_i5.p1  ORF type:complete len:602 (+),score=174.59 TRINITY_DN3435_c0_g1_i5:61-1866(+)